MQRKKEKGSTSSGLRNMFSLTHWKHNYTLLALLIIACVFMYRGTTDGLWFVSYAFFAFAKRLELRRDFNVPLLLWKEEGKTLREFGYARGLTGIISRAAAKKISINDFPNDILCYAFFTIMLLHIYTTSIIIFYNISPEAATDLAIFLNNIFLFLTENWPSYLKIEEGLINNGYEYRIPLIKNSYSISLLFTLFFYIFSFIMLCRISSFDEMSTIVINNIKKSINYNRKNTLVRCLSLAWFTAILLIFFLIFIFFLYNYASMPIIYPTEISIRSVKYAWLASHAYNDNISLFYPNYILPFFSIFPIGFILYLLSIIFKIYRNIIK